MNRILDQLALLLMLALLGLAIQYWEKTLAIISAGVLVVIVYLIIPRANRPEAERQIEKEEKKFEREPALGKLTVSKNSKPSEVKREFLLQPKSIRRQREKPLTLGTTARQKLSGTHRMSRIIRLPGTRPEAVSITTTPCVMEATG